MGGTVMMMFLLVTCHKKWQKIIKKGTVESKDTKQSKAQAGDNAPNPSKQRTENETKKQT